jgi:hypothetical protein
VIVEASDHCCQKDFVLVDTSTKAPIGIFYAAIQNAIRWLEPCALEFRFEDDRGPCRVEIIGGTSPDAPELMKRCSSD